ncbi:Yip1 domain protein [Candidatus Bilamarchaeum dharawalense]|uniref:Yip1 domain protein n=1 Tax=Candidatus Bilamarchaeum dharawalense TaxID=2885759 RepID=A0A5E4LVG2_9ARCH|nr:Yip1 domain protein [Candidatus Bilamarchaeum dharawalense]
MMNLEVPMKWVRSLIPAELDQIVEKDKGSLIDGLKNIVISSILPAACVFVVFLIMGLLVLAVMGTVGSLAKNGASALEKSGLYGGGYALAGIVMAIAIMILQPIMFILGTGVHWLLATVFGGKGSYSDHAFYASHIQAGLNILAPIIVFGFFIPCIGYLIMFLALAYPIYPYYRLIKKVHDLDRVKAAIVVVAPIVIMIIAAVLLCIPYIAAVFAVKW